MTTTTDKPSNEQRVIGALAEQDATVAELAAALEIGLTSTRKYLATLKQDGKVRQVTGGREGKLKQPDRYSLVSKKPAVPSPDRPAGQGSRIRLGKGKLDAMVLDYLRGHVEEGPLSASAVGKGLARSSGAVANCLKRLAEAGQVNQASEQPRCYEIAS